MDFAAYRELPLHTPHAIGPGVTIYVAPAIPSISTSVAAPIRCAKQWQSPSLDQPAVDHAAHRRRKFGLVLLRPRPPGAQQARGSLHVGTTIRPAWLQPPGMSTRSKSIRHTRSMATGR